MKENKTLRSLMSFLIGCALTTSIIWLAPLWIKSRGIFGPMGNMIMLPPFIGIALISISFCIALEKDESIKINKRRYKNDRHKEKLR